VPDRLVNIGSEPIPSMPGLKTSIMLNSYQYHEAVKLADSYQPSVSQDCMIEPLKNTFFISSLLTTDLVRIDSGRFGSNNKKRKLTNTYFCSIYTYVNRGCAKNGDFFEKKSAKNYGPSGYF
jgi:hypothetical protein